MQEQYRDEKEVNSEVLFQVTEEYFNQILHRSIGALTFRDHYNRPLFGSATLISKDLILTAAHNIYDKQRGLEYSQFKFYLAPRQSVDTNKDYYEILAWRYMPQFKICSSADRQRYDYALMKLKSNIERPIKCVEFLPLERICQECKKQGLKLSIFGYPCRLPAYPNHTPLNPQGTKIILNQYGLTCEGRVVSLDFSNGKITYAMNTYGGHSGSPITMQDKIIGVHNGAGLLNENFNLGRFVDPSLIQNITNWSNQMNAISPKINNHRHQIDINASIVSIIHEENNEIFQYRMNYGSIKNRKVSEVLCEVMQAPSYYLSLMYRQTLLLPHDFFNKIEEDQQVEAQIKIKVIPFSIRLYFYKIIYNQYKDRDIRDFFDFENIPDERTQRQEYIRFIINLYEGPQTRYYLNINRCLRQYPTYFDQRNLRILKLAVQLVKVHQGLRIQRDTIMFRSMANFFVNPNQNQSIFFPNFTASSPNRLAAMSFLRPPRGSFFKFKNLTGKFLHPYTLYPQDEEVLVLPFSQFSIEGRVMNGEIENITLAQLPGPTTYSKNIIIWVNDQPSSHQIQGHYNIEVLYLQTTQLFMKWFKIYGWLLKWKDIKVRIVTNMKREEEEGVNQEAGLSLIQYISNIQKCNNKILVIDCNQPEIYRHRAYQLGQKEKIQFSNSIEQIRKFLSFT